jgi:hypothetical protein
MRFIRFEDDCAYLKLTANPESNAYAEYVTVKSGVKGTNSSNRRSLTVERGGAPVVFEAAGTTHIILD